MIRIEDPRAQVDRRGFSLLALRPCLSARQGEKQVRRIAQQRLELDQAIAAGQFRELALKILRRGVQPLGIEIWSGDIFQSHWHCILRRVRIRKPHSKHGVVRRLRTPGYFEGVGQKVKPMRFKALLIVGVAPLLPHGLAEHEADLAAIWRSDISEDVAMKVLCKDKRARGYRPIHQARRDSEQFLSSECGELQPLLP